ncbi:MAG: urease accessory protein UreD [Actinophytocola sp.]|uniref:urease accessory protein UreD n=1 Tax=Actinophytocola sp. TaxID=1872138 RepID=UPI003D6AE8CF
MRAEALLAVEHTDGRDVVRVLRCAAPLTLVPARRRTGPALVHLVSSAATPLGGDELALTVHVGPCAALELRGIAATVALPGPHGAPSRSVVRLHLAAGSTTTYLPEPSVITARARHTAELHADLAADACLRVREVLVLGRTGERPGTLVTTTNVTRAGRPVLRQQLTVGDPALDASTAHLAGKRVLATDLHLDDRTCEPASGEWWSRTSLAAGGTLTTALADDAVTALRHLDAARSAS